MAKPSDAMKPIPVAQAAKILSRRARALGAVWLAVTVASVALLGARAGTNDLPFLGFLVLIGFAFGLYAMNPLMGASDITRAGEVLSGIQGLTVVKMRGVMVPRLDCVIAAETSSKVPWVVRFASASMSEDMSDPASFTLRTLWESVGDVMSQPARSYSDFPGLIDELVKLNETLFPQEYLWSDILEGRLESLVVPRWGLRKGKNEGAEEVRWRILDRLHRMEVLSASVRAEARFKPTMVRHPRVRRGWPGPFSLGEWCDRCRRKLSIWRTKSAHVCERCQGPTIEVLHRGDLSKKMQRVLAKGLL